MADRNQSIDALILSSKDLPSGHRVITLLGAETGVVDAFVFGGAKSSMRSSASPFIFANIKIYHDPVKQFIKVTDLSILESFFGIRDEYEKIMGASLISELVIKTAGCGGEYAQVLELTLRALRSIEIARESKAIVLAYLWHVLRIMGLGPDMDHCSHCGLPLAPKNSEEHGGFFMSDVQEGFQCSACARGGTWHSDSVRKYLGSVMESEIESVAGLDIPFEILVEIEQIVLPLAQLATEGSLQTLKRMDGNYFNSMGI